MGRIKAFWQQHGRFVLFILALSAILAGLLLYNLGGLTDQKLSRQEAVAAKTAYGWTGIFNDPLNLVLDKLRSITFFLAPDHGAFMTRLPNAIIGGVAILTFGWLIYLWHGSRTAILTTLLFATSAWTLHVSRLASYDVLYLWALPTLLLVQVLLHRHGDKAVVWYGSIVLWASMLYIPGLVWLIGLQLFLQRKLLGQAWRHFQLKRRVISVVIILLSLPLLVIDFTRSGHFIAWLGLPTDWAAPLTLLKQLVAVPVHMFIRGPQYPDLWLGRAPLLDAFTLVACGLGIYFYATHAKAHRSRMMGLLLGLSILLVALGGPVSFSLVVPMLYIAVATGIAYLLHDWFKTFPHNPLARGLGIGLVGICVAVSCVYNMRAYFVAWPHNDTTQATFRYHR